MLSLLRAIAVLFTRRAPTSHLELRMQRALRGGQALEAVVAASGGAPSVTWVHEGRRLAVCALCCMVDLAQVWKR